MDRATEEKTKKLQEEASYARKLGLLEWARFFEEQARSIELGYGYGEFRGLLF